MGTDRLLEVSPEERTKLSGLEQAVLEILGRRTHAIHSFWCRVPETLRVLLEFERASIRPLQGRWIFGLLPSGLWEGRPFGGMPYSFSILRFKAFRISRKGRKAGRKGFGSLCVLCGAAFACFARNQRGHENFMALPLRRVVHGVRHFPMYLRTLVEWTLACSCFSLSPGSQAHRPLSRRREMGCCRWFGLFGPSIVLRGIDLTTPCTTILRGWRALS